MKLRAITFVGTFAFLAACEASVEYTPTARQPASPVVGESDGTADRGSLDNDAVLPADEDVAVVEDATDDAEAPVQNTPQPLTNNDLLAMDEVVITAIVSANDTQYFSDIGNTAVTNAQAVANAGQLPTGQRMTANAVLNLRAGQRMTFCSHASSVAPLRVHAAQGSAFAHWGAAQVLNAGQCSTGLGYPEVLGANAVGNAPGNNLYNHNRAQNNSAIFVNIMQ